VAFTTDLGSAHESSVIPWQSLGLIARLGGFVHNGSSGTVPLETLAFVATGIPPVFELLNAVSLSNSLHHMTR
jgi:hypothetical protein